jgi:hypothetical protein
VSRPCAESARPRFETAWCTTRSAA